MTLHTKDIPWRIIHKSEGETHINAGTMHIATVHHAVGMFRVEADANARLIEHAPEMRELLFRCNRDGILPNDLDESVEKLLERLR
jgi:hypothetical protein